jgi:hypothetical protein
MLLRSINNFLYARLFLHLSNKGLFTSSYIIVSNLIHHFITFENLISAALILLTFLFLRAGDSSVGVATGYVLDDRMISIRLPAGAGDFSL